MHEINKILALFLAAALGLGVISILINNKIDDYKWGKRYERRKKIKQKIEKGNFIKKC